MQALELQEEGIVVKPLDSEWKSDDRSYASYSWLKIKPDYVFGCDFDCVVVGGWYGKGRRGGSVSQFLMAILEKAAPERRPGEPVMYATFCRVRFLFSLSILHI